MRSARVFLIMLLVIVLGQPALTGHAQAPPLQWCSMPPARTTGGGWSTLRTVRVDLNKDGASDVFIAYASRVQTEIYPPNLIEPVFDVIYVFKQAPDQPAVLEISASNVVGGGSSRLEGQACTVDIKQDLRASGRDYQFFSPESSFGKAFLAFYRKQGAADFQLADLIPRRRCADPPRCQNWETILVPPELIVPE